MTTMPGLPMFGHGQVEGFTEKYGMEYRRAKHDESVNEGLVRRHEEQIFPLLHRRQLFAEVDNFAFYDFEADGGGVNGRLRLLEPRAARRAHARRLSQSLRFDGWVDRRAAVTGRSLGRGLAVAEDAARFRSCAIGVAGWSTCARRRRSCARGCTCSSMPKTFVFAGCVTWSTRMDAGGGWPTGWAGAECHRWRPRCARWSSAPLHAALRSDDADAAVQEAAAVLGVPEAKARAARR